MLHKDVYNNLWNVGFVHDRKRSSVVVVGKHSDSEENHSSHKVCK